MQKNTNECFIIGSGRSLLKLTSEEKNYLNAHPHTLAMNKYLLFHEKIGVIPKAMFIGDFHFPAHKVFLETIKQALRLNFKPTYYADQYYKELFIKPFYRPYWNLKTRYNLYRNKSFFAPLNVSYEKLKFFKATLRDHPEFIWGESLNDELFFQRGSLSTALNIAYIIYPSCKIKLVGIDLTEPECFFEEELKLRSDLRDTYYDELAQKARRHFTAVPTQAGTVLDKFPLIKEKLKIKGGDLFCCNPNSLIVSEGLAEYVPIIEA
ncbi:MAG: hypothetical protein EA343_14080 [Nodularia sp. (in: Bacteria)]|nr:MAG: hypothetical protein EA343_14080 [Nodularia sp. (in: cyanobacteria)]